MKDVAELESSTYGTQKHQLHQSKVASSAGILRMNLLGQAAKALL